MDIICAKCGKHLSSYEATIDHSRHCKQILQGENHHWIPHMVPNQNRQVTPDEIEVITKLFNLQNISPQSKISPEEWKRLLESANLQNRTIPKMQTPKIVNEKVEMPSILVLIISFSIIGGVLFLLIKSLLSSK